MEQNKTILFIDDDVDFLEYVASSMRDCGYRVITRTDGLSALSLFDEKTPVDLIVTDYSMPGMNGLEFMAALRKRTQTVPVVLLTARGGVETYFRALNLGAFEVTSKPISMKTLLAIIKSAFESAPGGADSASSVA